MFLILLFKKAIQVEHRTINRTTHTKGETKANKRVNVRLLSNRSEKSNR